MTADGERLARIEEGIKSMGRSLDTLQGVRTFQANQQFLHRLRKRAEGEWISGGVT